MVSVDRWPEVERLYHDALARTAAERAGFLGDACGSDQMLRREIESLLTYSGDEPCLLDAPALDLVASTLRDSAAARLIEGRQLGPYRIEQLLGSGGMGDVYRARDTTLNRSVALKTLPAIFAGDADRRRRLEREARILASLAHPNLGAIYGLEDRDGARALVLELVEGRTLAERLRSGPLSIVETLTIARQIAEGMAAAHAQGIVHCDLKPANIAIGPNGVVKVLDFGLAQSPAEFVAAGRVIAGTPTYMSPEQARAGCVAGAVDVWAFGCVMFEMLTGRRVIDHAPEWQWLPARTPSRIVALLRQCLEPDPDRRLSDFREVCRQIDAAQPDRTRRTAAWAALAATLLTAAGAGYIISRDARAPARLSVSVAGSLSPQLSVAVSPDGQRLAYVATGASGRLMLWVRALDSLEGTALAGTESAAHPFWSPDGGSLGFQADGTIRTVRLSDGSIRTLADSPVRAGGSWSRDGLILFPRRGELAVVPADGGPVRIAVRGGEGRHQPAWPHFLPDGRHFLYMAAAGRPEQRGVYVGALDRPGTATHLLQTEFKAGYAGGNLLFVRDNTLFAQPFDDRRLDVTGRATAIATNVWVARGAAQASFSASPAGTLAYVNAAQWNVQLAWFDRSGRRRESIGAAGPYLGPPQLSPDATRVVLARGQYASEQLALLDLATGSELQFAAGPEREAGPVWSADGHIFFQASVNRRAAIYRRTTDDKRSAELIAHIDGLVTLDDVSPDGRFLVYTAAGPRSHSDLWLLPLADDRRPVVFRQTGFNKTQAQVARDGRWIAYTSYESGRDEVFVESFPVAGNKRQVSLGGGMQPRWRPGGGELYYIRGDGHLMAVTLSGKHDGPLQFGAQVPLFKSRVLPHGSQSLGLRTLYDVSSDGQRFLCLIGPDDSAPPLTVILNWQGLITR